MYILGKVNAVLGSVSTLGIWGTYWMSGFLGRDSVCIHVGLEVCLCGRSYMSGLLYWMLRVVGFGVVRDLIVITYLVCSLGYVLIDVQARSLQEWLDLDLHDAHR